MRVLLLSMYYPPLNTIAALRIGAFEKYLVKGGVNVDVITRYYDAEQQTGKSMFLGKQAAKDFIIGYLRNSNTIYTNFDEMNSKLLFSNKLPPIIKGLYNYFNVDVFHYGWIKYAEQAFSKEFSKNKYDFIISSYGPPISMLLAKRLSENYNIPFLIDFRDSYIDEKDVSYHLIMKRIILNSMLKNASGLIFSTDGMKEFFMSKVYRSVNNIPTCVIYNGVDEECKGEVDRGEVYEKFQKIKKSHDLLLLHTGTIYEGQNISFFIKSVCKYNEDNRQNVAIVFLGLAENNIKKIMENQCIYFLPKVNHSTALFFQKKASALLLPVWDGRYTGFSGKTQEYLFSENFIITSPNPQKDLKNFLDISPNVLIPKDYISFSNILDIIYKGKLNKIPLVGKEKLYRSFWVKKLNEFLVSLK